MKTRVIYLLLLCTVAAIRPSAGLAESIDVSILLDGTSDTVTLQQPLRLSQFLEQQQLAYGGQAHINFSRARIGNRRLQQQLEQQRNDVLDELTSLMAYYQKAGAVDAAVAVRELQQQVQRINLFAAYQLSIQPDALRLDGRLNFLMSAAESPYQLALFSGPVVAKRYGVDGNNPAANNSYHWRIAANGNVAREPVALFNTDELSRCYQHDFGRPLHLGSSERCVLDMLKPFQRPAYHVYVGITPELLPPNFVGLNERIVTLLKFAIEEGYGN